MKINEVKRMTGLTKKAIRYYEKKELLFPNVNSDNGYKDYSQKDVDNLKTIAFLRNIDMPVVEIRAYLSFPKEREKILKKHVKQIENRINDLETIRELTNCILKEDSADFYKLNSHLINKQIMNKNFVLRRLASLFPNAYGKYVIIHFGRFMNEPLDNEEKQKAFYEIVEFLDGVGDIDFPDEYLKYLNEIDETELIEAFSNINSKLKEVSNINTENKKEIEKLRSEVECYIQKQYSDEYREQYQKMKQIRDQLRESLEKSGYYEKFIENLKIISSSYRDYTEKSKKINEVLGLEYDKEGNIIMNK
ncbi:MAG: MerR family transcriptional regulator [Maledivibacter sp.]|jgi:DNA-binding transcriptional MerR regulator|nr:MerR family transcriptional regulator [Maledivibacter sp.]